MTRKQLRAAVMLVVTAYAGLALLGAALRLLALRSGAYEAYKEMAPFIFAIPAALLGYAFQQRGSYLTSLRALWSKLVQSVNLAVQYTYDDQTTQRQHAEVMTQLAVAIDEVRGVYRNVGEGNNRVGQYPYEPVKHIYVLLHDLGYGSLAATRRRQTREQILAEWQSIRYAFLSEFDRAEPSAPIVEQPDAVKHSSQASD
jgi:hypothetical protein